jgi:hypothetical protein
MKLPEKYRVRILMLDPLLYPYLVPYKKFHLKVIASFEPNGWNHVSVSLEHRNPSWNEMCFVKDLFFDEEELCLQFHPAKSEYVNLHNHCLHIWQPPKELEKYLEDFYKLAESIE